MTSDRVNTHTTFTGIFRTTPEVRQKVLSVVMSDTKSTHEFYGAKVMCEGETCVLLDITKIEDETILNFLKDLKHTQSLMNVAILTLEEWEALKNLREVLET
jgi:hypothetical protein